MANETQSANRLRAKKGVRFAQAMLKKATRLGHAQTWAAQPLTATHNPPPRQFARRAVPIIWRVPSKYMCLFMDGMVGPDFEKGLATLKSASETH